MATENTGVDGMSSISVPVGVVRLLEDRHGGINPILDDLKKKHLIDVGFEGITLKLRGQCADILDIVVEYLQEIAGKVPVVTTAPIIRYILGGKGTVAAILRGKYSELFQHLFDAEQQDLIKIKFMKKDQAKAETITFSCKYSEYPTFKLKMKEIETKLKECNKTERTVKIEKKDQTRAKQFQQRSGNTTFYCFLRVGKKEDNNAEMVFYGREENSCKDGISQCLSFVRGDTKHSSSVSPPKKTENAKEPSETTACNLPDNQNAPETMRSDRDTAESVTDTPSKATQKADGDRATFATSSSSEQKPTTAKSDWSTATAATSLSSTKSLNLSKPEINNDLLSDKSKSASDSKHIISAVSASGVETDKTRSISYEERITTGKITGSGDAERYSFQICDMHVYVYKESITEIKGMDAVTNAANERMMHGGGVAFYISKAAGHRMNQDCNQYIQKNGLLQVTQNYVSVPGDMKCKGIIHAVGPTWYDYKENEKNDCARDLYETVKNVLITANSQKWKKVALSAISSGLFGVPKTLCAEMYIKAFADFATKTDGTVKEVHFIDVNREILNLVIDAHKKWETDPSKLDFKNAFEYMSTTLQSQTRKGTERKSGKNLIQFLEQSRTSYGASTYKYRVCETLDVYVYQGSLTRLQTVDAIAVTISPNINEVSVLQYTISNAAGSRYDSEFRKHKKRKEGDVIVTGNGMLGCKNVVHIVSPLVRRLDEESLQVLSKVYRLAVTSNSKSKIRSLGIPLFGTSAAYSRESGIQVLCRNVLQTLIDVCKDGKKYIKVEELHLVNLDDEITSYLQKEFTRWTADLFGGQQTRNRMPTVYHSGGEPRSGLEEHRWIQHKPLDETTDAASKSVTDGMGKHIQNKSTMIGKAPNNVKCTYCNNKAEIALGCNHMYCTACSVSVKQNRICMKCSGSSKATPADPANADKECPICLDPLKNAQELPCRHKLCTGCFERVKKQKPQCPVCQQIFGVVTGNQPNGEMFFRHMPWKRLEGYDNCGTIEIYYSIPPGKQGKYHPHPGRPYNGVERRAYLPDNKEGNEVLCLLRRAFDRKLVFTIGDSRTTGKEDVITWNDIHHKTKTHGGPEKFGYPDPSYLSRVKEELAAKGVTE